MRTMIVALSVAVAVALAALPAEAEVVAYYSFDDDTATDLSANGNHGIVGSAVAFSSDTPSGTGRAASGQGVNNSDHVIRVPSSPSLQSYDDELTAALWVKVDPASPTWGRVVQQATGNEGWRINRYSDSVDMNVRVDTIGFGGQFNQNIARGGPAVIDDEWHHLVYTLSVGTWVKYLDGVEVARGTYNHGDGFGNANPLYILGRNNFGNYTGLVDDVVIYDTALSGELVGMLSEGANPLNIPEPATLSLLGLGALALVRRRRKS